MDVSFLYYLPEKKRSISYVNNWKLERKLFEILRSFKNYDFNTLANRDKTNWGFDVEHMGTSNYIMLENKFSWFWPWEYFFHFRIDNSVLFRVFAGKKSNEEIIYILIIDSKWEINHK